MNKTSIEFFLKLLSLAKTTLFFFFDAKIAIFAMLKLVNANATLKSGDEAFKF